MPDDRKVVYGEHIRRRDFFNVRNCIVRFCSNAAVALRPYTIILRICPVTTIANGRDIRAVRLTRAGAVLRGFRPVGL